MMNKRLSTNGLLKAFSLLAIGVAGLITASSPGYGQAASEQGVGPFRTQTIQLEAGWNAVYLEIEPTKVDPSALFAGTPIEIAAAYFRPVTAMEFIDSPTDVLPDRKGWSVWYAPDRPDALLGNLHAIQAHHAYLLYSKNAYTWSLRGRPFFDAIKWHPNAFSLVGFPIDAAEQPTIAEFFAGAAAHTPLKIYRLANGQWTLVSNPAQAMMKPGAAYWVYSKGASDFRGPLEVDFKSSAAGGLVFKESTGTRRIQIRNVSPNPQDLTLTLQGGTTGTLPLSYVVRVLGGSNQPIDSVSIPFPSPLKLGPLETGQAFLLELEVAQEAVSTPVMSSTLSISTTAGLRIEVPLVSIRTDLLASP